MEIHLPTGTKCTIKNRNYTIHAWWHELNKDKREADMYQFVDDESGLVISKTRQEFVDLYLDKTIKNIKL